MKNSKLRKVLLLACSAVLLVCLSVGATIAYLTSTDEVVNTFAVGNVKITMDETQVDVYGEAVTPAARTKANTYKLVPGHDYLKDPIIYVAANSEDCFLYVKIVNDIAGIESGASTAEYAKIADQMANLGWTPVAEGSNIWYASHNVMVEDQEVSTNIYSAGDTQRVFNGFSVADDAVLTDTNGDSLFGTGKSVTITAYAIQADGFANAAAAWEAAKLN